MGNWRNELLTFDQLTVPRCFKPSDFGCSTSVELHYFSDASTQGYGQCSYLRLKDHEGHLHCSFVMSKAGVTPLKPVTVPRLELTAAAVSVRTGSQLQRELDYEEITDVFWTENQGGSRVHRK